MNKKLKDNKTKQSWVTVVIVVIVITLSFLVFSFKESPQLQNGNGKTSEESSKDSVAEQSAPNPEYKQAEIKDGRYINYEHGFMFDFPEEAYNDSKDRVFYSSDNTELFSSLGYFQGTEKSTYLSIFLYKENVRKYEQYSENIAVNPGSKILENENDIYTNRKVKNISNKQDIPGYIFTSEFDLDKGIGTEVNNLTILIMFPNKDTVLRFSVDSSNNTKQDQIKRMQIIEKILSSIAFFNPENPPKEIPKFDSDKMD